MTSTAKVDTLRVPGARLYHEVRGDGPVLLMMSPGHGDADSYLGVAGHLAERHTVVTFDRRGYARSPLDDPTAEQRVETHADDAAYLLAELGGGPAQVFGSSAGAVIALDLVTRHPHLVSMLVAHEPPVVSLLPAAERPKPPADLVERVRRDGPTAALAEFRTLLGVTHDDHEPGVDLAQQRNPRAAANAAFFFSREVGMLDRYTPDVAALRVAPTRIVPAGGATGREQFPYRCAAALAELLGTPLVEFPGGHAGFVSHPRAFADQLRTILGG